jgi:internalin A
LVKLEELYIWRNNIKDISPLKSMVGLKQLMISQNPIEDISAVQNMVKLMYFNCANCNIKSIEQLDYLKNLKLMKSLAIMMNPISDSKDFKIALNNLIKSFNNLKELKYGDHNDDNELIRF